MERFQALRGAFGACFPQARFHFANSAAIWNQKNYGLRAFRIWCDRGFRSMAFRLGRDAPPYVGFRPFCRLEARVVHVAQLKTGESIGYGATFKARK